MADRVEPTQAPGTQSSQPWRTESTKRLGVFGAVALVPLLILLLVRAKPTVDLEWLNLPAHFWLVLIASGFALTLGYSVSTASLRRRDARLFLVSLGFNASAGFLGLHALATPGVLLAADPTGPNPGFEMATPVGLLLGGVFMVLSAREFSTSSPGQIIDRSRLLMGGLTGVIALWAIFSLARIPPLAEPIVGRTLDVAQTLLGAIGVLLYATASWGYLRLYQKRKAAFIFRITFAFALLAEAMVVIVFAINWRISWWEWHALMLGAFMVISLAARSEWHEERFSTVYLEETLFGAREVSILFADLKGFTSFSESHDIPAVVEMLNAYFSKIVPLMQDLEGEVHQIVGDAIMVTFNQLGNQPNHAFLAARAALALQVACNEVAEGHPEWPRFRAGVNTGQVIAGVVGGARGHRKHAVVGDTVNLAARFESSAPVGEVVMGQPTYDGLPEGTTVQVLEPMQLKGKSQPVPAFLLKGLP